MAMPLDYVFAGAEVLYMANVDPAYYNPSNPAVGIERSGPIEQQWYARFFTARNLAWTHYQVLRDSGNHIAGSVMLVVKVAGDMRSINDVKATIDGAVMSAGLRLRASMVRFLSNPRRDGVTQPPVNTPGVPPPVTRLPREAGNIDTKPPTPHYPWAGLDLSKALDDLTNALGLKQIADSLGVSAPILLVGGAVVLVVLLKR